MSKILMSVPGMGNPIEPIFLLVLFVGLELATGAVSVTGAPVSQGVSLLPFASHPAGAFLLLAFAAAGAKAFTGTMGRNNR